MKFCLKNNKKDIILTDDDEEQNRNINICWFREKDIYANKVHDYCHITETYKSPTHEKCRINVEGKQSNFFPLAFHGFETYDCRLFFKSLIDMGNVWKKLEVFTKTSEWS